VGDVLRVLATDQRVVVSGVNVIKRHTKPSRTDSGGIIEREAAIHVSNVALLDPKTDKRPKSASSSSKTAGKCALRAVPAKQ